MQFDIDVSLDFEFSFELALQFRQIIVDSGSAPPPVDDTAANGGSGFDVSIGASVPTTVTLTPLPVALLSLFPQFEGYLFFMLPDGRIVVVHPTSLKIVLIIYAA